MATISQLEREYQKEKAMMESKKEIEEIGNKRKYLQREIKRMRFQRKHPLLVKIATASKKRGSAKVPIVKKTTPKKSKKKAVKRRFVAVRRPKKRANAGISNLIDSLI